MLPKNWVQILKAGYPFKIKKSENIPKQQMMKLRFPLSLTPQNTHILLNFLDKWLMSWMFSYFYVRTNYITINLIKFLFF